MLLNPTEYAQIQNRHLRLVTLIRLRWLAIIGQALAIGLVSFVLEYQLPVAVCMSLVSLSALLNIGLRVAYPSTQRLGPGTATFLLGYDVFQLASLLYLTGGLENPFSFLLLVPPIISATALPLKNTIFLGLLSAIAASILIIQYLPLPWNPDETFSLSFTYLVGIWVSLLASLLFIGVYVFSVAEESRQIAAALQATELVLAHEQQLTALDGLAAAAAHELGTPLATIALVSKELQREFSSDSPHMEDLVLIREQASRCRDILGKLNSLSSSGDAQYNQLLFGSLLEEVVAPHRNFGVELNIDLSGDGEEPLLVRNPGLLYGLGNIIENAVDYARTTVRITGRWNAKQISVSIEDDGPGFPSEIFKRLGEPYITSRSQSDPHKAAEEPGGLGLGFFIAKTLLERSGGHMVLQNKTNGKTGAVINVHWSRETIETAGEALGSSNLL